MALSGVTKITSAAVEEVVTPVAKEVVQQVMTPELSRLFYGNMKGVPSDKKYGEWEEFHRIKDAQDLASTRQQHARLLGKATENQTGQQPVLNPFSNKQTDKVGGQQVRTAVQDLKLTAEDLGVEHQDAREQQRRKEELEAEKKAREEAEKRARLETKIEAPPGKITGLVFKRKGPTQRMQKPPKSAETRASQGIGG